MSFTPMFMRSFKAFDRERRALRSAAEWRAFRTRWFDRESWPGKSKDRLRRELARRHRLVARIRDGRSWAPGFWTVDLAPEARYQYFWTLRTIGDPLLDPGLSRADRVPGSGWQQECGYCNISTRDPGGPDCPACGRELYWQFVAD